MFRTDKDQLKDTFKKLLEQSSDLNVFLGLTENVKRKIEKGLLYRTVSLTEFDSIREQVLNESILDPIQKERCKLVFNKNDKMHTEVKNWILNKIEDWKKTVEFNFEINEIHMYGSSTGYQYTDTSDIDLHALTNLAEEEIEKIGKLISLGMLLENDKNPVTLFLIPEKEKLVMEKFENLYNIKTDEWLKKADKNDYEVPYGYILELSEFFMNAFDLSLSQYERAKQEYLTYLKFNPDTQEITEREKNERVDRALTDLKAAHDRVRMGKKIMMSFAKEGYDGNEFEIHVSYNTKKDPRLSVNNSIYKMIEKFGYKDKLSSVIKDGADIISNNKGINESINLICGERNPQFFKIKVAEIGPENKSIKLESYYTDNDLYIGDYNDFKRYTEELKLTKLQSVPDGHVVCVGWSDSEKKWYGWSHRAKYGFRPGDIVKKGDILNSVYPIGYKIETEEQAHQAAIAFAREVS